MSDSSHAARHPLVHVRGGAAMLLAALVGALPPPAQVLLRTALRIIPLLAMGTKPQYTAALIFARRLLLPLLTGAFPTLSSAQKPAKRKPSSATLFETLVRAVVVYALAEKLLEANRGVSCMLTTATASSLCSEEELLHRLLVAVLDAEAPTLFSTQLSVTHVLPTARQTRKCSAFFCASTRIALKAYLDHLHSRPSTSPLTIFVPGLLTAPWTTHLLPLLRNIYCRQGTAVVGYDICVDAKHYDVDLRHLRSLILQKHGGTVESRALSPASSATAPAGVLVIASIRGRRIRNVTEASLFAKMNGLHILELRVPTLPLGAIQDLEPQPRPSWMRMRQVQCANSSVRSDICLTAFDDAGMYGGVVVDLCTSDTALLACVKNCSHQGQVARCGSGAARQTKVNGTSSPAVEVTLRSLPSSVLTAGLDAASDMNELITKFWCPWARRLCTAAWREASVLHQGSIAAQEAFVTLRRFTGKALRFPPNAQAQLRQLVSLRKSTHRPSDDDGAPEGVLHNISADVPVEQRTTYISSPMPPLRNVMAHAAPETLSLTPVDQDSGQWRKVYRTSAKTKFPAQATPAALTAPEALTNWAVESRIRLRWSSLLMSPNLATEGVPRVAHDASSRDRTSVAYLSLWSFVAQLPPWVVAISAADDGETTWGDHRSSSCVEASATALLVRLAQPASPQVVAKLLRDEALVDAVAVRTHTWDSLSTSPDATALQLLTFEEAVVFAGCAQAAQLSEALLYLPLSPSLPFGVRTKMLRVLWEKLPPAKNSAHPSKQSPRLQHSTTISTSSSHIQATINFIYRMHLRQAQRECAGNTLCSAAATTNNSLHRTVSQDRRQNAVVSDQDAKIVQQYLFGGTSSPSGASLLAAGTLLKPVAKTWAGLLASKL